MNNSEHLARLVPSLEVAAKKATLDDAKFISLANPANILTLLEALEYYKSREERVTKLVMDNSKSWDKLYDQLKAKDNLIAELRSQKFTVNTPDEIVDKVCLTAAEIHNRGQGVNDDNAQNIIDRIREILTTTFKK